MAYPDFHIRAVIRGSPSPRATLLESSVGTCEQVLPDERADWVHFTCRDIQDAASLAESGLCLADSCHLKLRNITALSRPHDGLAFLSACRTAMGEEALSDEAIHSVAGMLFAGYGRVVGMMWSISDNLAPEITIEAVDLFIFCGNVASYGVAMWWFTRAT